MNSTQYSTLLHALAESFRPSPTQPPAEWVVSNLMLNESSYSGPYSLLGFEYAIEVLNDFADTSIRDEVLVWGSQTRKTGTLMGGVAWAIANDPSGIIWAMPTKPLAQSFSETRWQRLIKASPGTSPLVPMGRDANRFKNLEQQFLGGAVLNFIGSNSASELSSRPARRTIADEVDKFNEGGTKEADAVNLVEQRTKGQICPQHWKTSTPTIVEGLIWQEYLKGDQRRYFVPCPHCGKQVLFAWSKNYTVLAKTGKEAYVVWDKEAKVNGKWDLERVKKSAHAVCPHCSGHILDGHKTAMVRNGVWISTATAPSSFRSRQLSSLYSSSPETSFGNLAVKFLEAKNSLLGLQGFINGDLAEPYQAQDTQGERVELITSQIEVTAEWKKIETVDCQQKSPYFWYVIRAWNGGNSEGIEAGPLDTWDEVAKRQEANTVPDVGVFIDSGFGARSDIEVYKTCSEHGTSLDRGFGKLPFHVGWTPVKGQPGYKRWRDEESGLMLPYRIQGIDPFIGTADAGLLEMGLFLFSSDTFKDVLDNLRKKQTEHKWIVPESMSTDEYWRHMDGEIKMAVQNKSTGRITYQWQSRSRHWPNHLLDCENMQVAAAMFLGIFEIKI